MEWSVLLFVHLVGLALGVGSATGKVVLLIRCYRDVSFITHYLKVVKPLTQILVLGLILMTVSGVIWLILGYGFPPLMIVKLVLVGLIWIMGMFIDNVTEPAFIKMATSQGEPASAALMTVMNRHMAMEVVATLLFYVVIILGVML